MGKTNIILLFFLALLPLAHLYALENRWMLRNSQTSALKGLKPNIYFEFDRSLSNDGRSTIGYLAITACNLMTYNYQISDAQIFLRFLSMGRSTRPCSDGEIAFIRTQLDQTFQFYILYSTLLLKPPNNSPPIKFDLVPNSILPPINGMWVITQTINKTTVNDGKVIINGTLIAFCQGNQTFSYNLTKNAKIRTKLQKNLSNCNNGLLKSFVESVSFYQLNTLKLPQTLSFFDKQVKKLLQLTYQDSYFTNKQITPNNFRVYLNPPSTSNPSSIINTNNSTGIKPNASSVLPKTNVSQDNKATISPNSISSNASNNTQIKPNITNSTNNFSITSNSTQKNNFQTLSNTTKNSNSSVNLTKNTSNNSISSSIKPVLAPTPTPTPTPSSTSTPIPTLKKAQTNPTAPIINLPQSYSIVSQQNQVFGVWYPSTTVIPPSLTQSDLSKYQVLINGARIMLNGGCNTIFTTYSFSNGSFKPNNIVSTSNSCPNSKDAVMQNILMNQKNIYYLTGAANKSKISINSPQNSTLLILTQNAPS